MHILVYYYLVSMLRLKNKNTIYTPHQSNTDALSENFNLCYSSQAKGKFIF